jgi:MFS family permease
VSRFAEGEFDLTESTMTDRERQGWIVVGAIFVTMFFIWGAINCSAVFFVPVLNHFGWTRAKLSVALSIGWVTGGAAGPLIGWLADRIDPKRMMIVGAAVTGLAWLALSRATNFGEFLAINGLFGICVGAATYIPCSLVIASWFERRRGLAIGIAFSGATLGGAAMTIVATHAITVGGWRTGYLTLALPILLLVVPLILIFVRMRNAAGAGTVDSARHESAVGSRDASVAIELPGLELWQARKTRSFWLISVIQFFGGVTIGMGPHFVAYLTGIGYTANFAATVISLYLIATTAGTLLGGPFADRISARAAMAVSYILSSLGMIGLFTASHPLGLALNILAGGFALGALTVQMPLIIIESLGVKRFGSVLGTTGVFYTIGAAASPIVTGRVFDVSGSYSAPILSFVVLLILCSLAVLGCKPLSREEERFAPLAASVAIGAESTPS